MFRPPAFVCRRCARTLRCAVRARPYSSDKPATTSKEPDQEPEPEPDNEPKGAMSRQLEQATEDALLLGGRAGRRAIEEAGFSEALKNRLLARITDAQFTAEHRSTIAVAGLDPTSLQPVPAGQGTREHAAAAPWTGDEDMADGVLRMLDDARKPLPPGLRGKATIPTPTASVDLSPRRQPVPHAGQRVEAARNKVAAYTGVATGVHSGLNDTERAALRQEFRDRFTPDARPMPVTMSGMASLANERIEEAMARGKFRHIARGPGVERDQGADNPFVDTTEYLLNRMIQRQAMAPPWIEKQQELVRALQHFRTRLRSDWRRHAALAITDRGGSLEAQMARARAYAAAEQVADIARLFRDAQWESSQRTYLELAVANLNTLTRSYNLMAPELAKKPYLSLDRELRTCFADVAPTLADAIREKSVRPSRPVPDQSTPGGSLRRRLAGEGAAQVHDSKTPNYGLKDMWRDWWK